MRLLLQHDTVYRFPRPAALGPHQVRLRPADHARARIESYALRVTEPAQIRWQRDPSGNHVAHVSFPKGARLPELAIRVELAVDIRPVNPFDFFLDDRCETVPFRYPDELAPDLAPFLDRDDPSLAGGPGLDAFLAGLPSGGATVPFVVELNRLVNERVRYVIREEAGIWTPEETLRQGRGSCRDSAQLLVAALRSRGLAARFVSGYLVQLTDEGMIPDEPRGVGRDVVDLHAWAEVFLPGGGWIGLDATSGLLCGEGHIPLACVARPALGAPVIGTSDVGAESFGFEMRVGRLGHEARPTTPYPEETWEALLEASDRADAALAEEGLTLTVGGEPTFNSRLHPEAPEWRGEALGPTKWEQGKALAEELRDRMAPGGAILRREGKWYPGESLPRWALDVVGMRDGTRLWTGGGSRRVATPEAAETLVRAIATRLGVGTGSVRAAYEDPWQYVRDEADLPPGVDPTKADLADAEDRRRLARVLDHGLSTPSAWALPLARGAGGWSTDRWTFRRERLFLIPGDAPAGLRLPLRSLGGPLPSPAAPEPAWVPDPRAEEVAEARRRAEKRRAAETGAQKVVEVEGARPVLPAVRTALCVEPRGGELFVFLPPLPTAADFVELVRAVDASARETGLEVRLEGYPPPWSPEVVRFSVTPDPGVLEVNVQPTRSGREAAAQAEQVFDAALHAGLHAEKYMLDGRQEGSGGGNHVTLGGPTPLESPFVVRPDLLASLVTFAQHHPAVSYLFTGLFVGPTSQAPRVDEARHEGLYELEIALRRLSDRSREAPPWLGDWLLRNLLVDVTGNGHRAEISIDKLFDWRSPHGRQGLVELRAFEMPPHPRMAAAQAILARALVAAFAREPYRHDLVRWGTELHDRFLLPFWLWRDMEEVLAFLESRGVGLPREAYRPFVEFRCPVVGRLQSGGVSVELRNALEPWPVLGEEPGAGGTARFVDSSLERVEVRVEGFEPERWAVLVNGIGVPLRATGTAGEHVGGVRFRAWAPPSSLQPHLGIHHPLRFDLWDRWGNRSVGACAYHVWHPEGRAFDAAPLTRFEAAARRAQRFTEEGPLPWPTRPRWPEPHPEYPNTLDLRRQGGDRPMPRPEEDEED
ncbi:MAG TPA: transglutaminase family protein [Anaeromyxobacteraceae bacterium]|nr:transglutaminase family protein [Anaeromyxobacteraceae bacterium]